MKIDGSEVRGGMIIEYKNKLQLVVRHQIVAPGNWRAFNQLELKDIMTGSKSNERVSSDEKIERVSLEQRPYQYLFSEGDNITFMNNETYEQVTVNKDMLGDKIAFLSDGMNVIIETHEGRILNVTLPERVEMVIAEAEPVVKGQTASSSYKTAVLENGVRILVPPFIEAGTRVVVNTNDSSYVERASK